MSVHGEAEEIKNVSPAGSRRVNTTSRLPLRVNSKLERMFQRHFEYHGGEYPVSPILFYALF